MLKPPTLDAGDTIGVFAPSSCIDRIKIDQSTVFLREQGYNVHIHEQTWAQHNQSAGTTQQKLDAFHELIQNNDIKAIFAAGGGNRAGYMLDGIDYELVRNNPKILLGFSDVTALLNGLHKKTGLVTFHGPDMGRLFRMPVSQQNQLFDMLSGGINLHSDSATILKTGNARGNLFGGNLSVLCSLIGTPYQPDFQNALLFIEDCDDEMNRYDRMLLQMKNAGILSQISGLLIGSFTNTKDTGKRPFGFSLEDIIADLTNGLNIPIVTNLPFGHGENLYTYPVGVKAELQTQEGKTVSLKLLEPAVRTN